MSNLFKANAIPTMKVEKGVGQSRQHMDEQLTSLGIGEILGYSGRWRSTANNAPLITYRRTNN